MEKQLLVSDPVGSRRGILKTSCDRVIEFQYLKRFQPEEITEFKTILSEVMIKLDAFETQLNKIKDEFKESMKPLKKEVHELLTFIRDKARLVTEECYIMFDGDMVGIYNGDGELVHERPMEASEKQKTIFMEQRASGTHGN